jgi:hypothetical protein
MTIRPHHVEKLIEAQRVFDHYYRRGDIEGENRSAAIIGGLYRNASDEERRAYQAQLDPAGHVPLPETG